MEKAKKFILPIIIVLVLIIIAIILSLFLTKEGKDQNTKFTEEIAKEYIEKINKVLIQGGTKEEIISTIQVSEENILKQDIMTGKEMYLLQTPSKNITKENDIKEYQKAAQKVAKKLEKAIQENFEYKVIGVANEKNYMGVLVSYKTFYYNAYINDLHQIQNELLIRKGYDFESDKFKPNNKFKLDQYKAKIKAATILDKYLNDYKNKEEINKVYVNFDNYQIENNSENFISYMMNIEGYTYEFQGKIIDAETLSSYVSGINSKNALKLN